MTRIVTLIALPALLLGAMALPIAAQASPNNVNARFRNQENRIHNGVRTGQLTRGEYARVQSREIRLRRQEAYDRLHNNGRLTAGEHARLERRENADSRTIYRLKHNDRVR